MQTNADIAATFEHIAKILNLRGENVFRVRAYQRAAQTIASLSQELRSIYEEGGRDALLEIAGIGQDLADKIVEMITTGTLAYITELQKKVPKGLFDIMDIQGLGPKKTKFLWEKYDVKTIADLEKVLASGKLNDEKGWGAKSVENALRGIAAKKAHTGRTGLPKALAVAEAVRDMLVATQLCDKIDIAGSVRRCKDTIGDIDLLVSSASVDQVMKAFCSYGEVEQILAQGPTKSSVRLKNGVQADLRVVDSDVFGAALHYFTGSKDHNVRLRQMGMKQGLTISEYGVHKGTAEKKGKLLASKTEDDIYASVGLPFIPPELRENRGEFEAAEKHQLPTLITLSDLRGDLHLHSNFSDGSATMIDMAKAAKAAGHEYIAITDHGSPMEMVYGIKKENIKDYLKKIDATRSAVPDLHILAGTEVDILEDGSLYLPDSVLKQLDWVVASVHGNFNLSSAAMTKRILRAIEHPLVDVIAHPTARLLLRRDPIEYDMEAVLKAASVHHVAMEINASTERMDLHDIHIRRAKELGVMLVINSDAHHPRELSKRFGITQARRGWCERTDVLNTKSWKELEKWRK